MPLHSMKVKEETARPLMAQMQNWYCDSPGFCGSGKSKLKREQTLCLDRRYGNSEEGRGGQGRCLQRQNRYPK